MTKIIKAPNYRQEPVVVADQKVRRFVASHFQDPLEVEPDPDPNEVEAERLASAVEAAEARALEIVAEAEERVAAITREAMARGYADGRAEGLRGAEDQFREHLERLAELARRATIDRETMVRSTEQELATLALEIASKVIRREVASDPTIVLSMVESAIDKVGKTDSVRILVNSDDASLVLEKWSELRGAVAFGANWEVVGDDHIDRGGCVIETKTGMVDSRIEAQLAEIVTAFEVGQ